jgi:hypothetical protein
LHIAPMSAGVNLVYTTLFGLKDCSLKNLLDYQLLPEFVLSELDSAFREHLLTMFLINVCTIY